MNYNLKICKTDVKIYDINIDIDFADLKSWVDETQYDYQEFLEMNYDFQKTSFQKMIYFVFEYLEILVSKH